MLRMRLEVFFSPRPFVFQHPEVHLIPVLSLEEAPVSECSFVLETKF